MSTTLAAWLVGAAVMAISAASGFVEGPTPTEPGFEAPRAVVLHGYGGGVGR